MYGMHNLNNLSDLVLSGLMFAGIVMIALMALIGFIKVVSVMARRKDDRPYNNYDRPYNNYDRKRLKERD